MIEQQIGDDLCRLSVQCRAHVAVGPQGDGDRGVAEALLDDPGMDWGETSAVDVGVTTAWPRFSRPANVS